MERQRNEIADKHAHVHSPGVGFLAGPELLDFYETAIASTTFSALVSLGLLERATFSILCAHFFSGARALRQASNSHRTCAASSTALPSTGTADPHSTKLFALMCAGALTPFFAPRSSLLEHLCCLTPLGIALGPGLLTKAFHLVRLCCFAGGSGA